MVRDPESLTALSVQHLAFVVDKSVLDVQPGRLREKL
jgi:hypothetical protein